MEERYERNLPALTAAQQRMLLTRRVLIAGCGGLGGWLTEYLARLGVGELTVADGDRFEASNLNRQMLCTETALGKNKAAAAAARVAAVNSQIKARAAEVYLTPENAAALVRGQDAVLDALDNVPARLALEAACAAQNVPLIHGAVLGWSAQVSTVLPGSGALRRLYAAAPRETPPAATLSFAAAFCAAAQCAEAVRVLCGEPPRLAGRLLLADLRDMDWEIVQL